LPGDDEVKIPVKVAGMLRVIASRNAKEYFKQSLKREDYYSQGQEISGDWQGIGAEKLGLSGALTTAAFESL
jgi:hypothetical protein